MFAEMIYWFVYGLATVTSGQSLYVDATLNFDIMTSLLKYFYDLAFA